MIYDWDDTILCTSYINDFRFVWLPTQVKILMNQLDEYAVLFYCNLGKITI